MSASPEYVAHINAMRRCRKTQRDPDYPNYAGRGIRFLFTSFEEFFAALGPKPSAEFTLERVNNDGHYEPGNVRWATRREQNKNQRPKRLNGYRTEDFRKKCTERNKKQWAAGKRFLPSHLGHKHSGESKARLREAWVRRRKLYGLPKPPSWLGKKHSDETKQRMREAWKRRKLANHAA